MNVRMMASDIYPGDAIGNFTLGLYDYLTSIGLSCILYARHYDQNKTPFISDFDRVFDEICSDDIVFFQFSIYEHGVEKLSLLRNKKIVYFHGITPPDYFSDWDVATSENCRKGLLQFSSFVDYDFFLANSNYTLLELGRGVGESRSFAEFSKVLPPVLVTTKAATMKQPRVGGGDFLYVGRLAPHKKIVELVDWFEHYYNFTPSCTLTLVGSASAKLYHRLIIDRIKSLPRVIADRVSIDGFVSDDQLHQHYSNADALITLSEHEGFCVPILEAISYGLPVFARNSAAIPGTLGRKNLLLDQQKLSTYAYEVYCCMNNPTQLESLLSGQVDQLDALVSINTGKSVAAIIKDLL
jgi:glycosyltransferase involved in cell wall biosynthesis